MFACRYTVSYRIAVIYQKSRLLVRGAASSKHALPPSCYTYLWSCRGSLFRKLIYKNKLLSLCSVFSWISSLLWFATCQFKHGCGCKGGVATSGWDGARWKELPLLQGCEQMLEIRIGASTDFFAGLQWFACRLWKDFRQNCREIKNFKIFWKGDCLNTVIAEKWRGICI